MSLILLANIINAIGAITCILAHGQISVGKDDKRGFYLYASGCALLTVGSAMLLSWPVVILNILWLALSVMALRKENYFKHISSDLMQGSLYVAASIGAVCVFMGLYDAAAYMTTYIYFIAYALLCGNERSKLNYLVWCSIGFVMLIPHLFIAFQYSVMGGETLGFVISLIAIYKTLFKEKEAIAVS
jgi:hypothetical protein